MGGLAGATPGGFLAGMGAEVTGLSDELPRPMRMGYGVGEASWGLAQIIGGGLGDIGGGTLSATGIGAFFGVPVMVASTALVVEGSADVATGAGIIMASWSYHDPAGRGGPEVPELDEDKQKLHTDPKKPPLPDRIPDEWGRGDLRGLAHDLQTSVRTRIAERKALGEAGKRLEAGHHERLRQELRLLRQILKRLKVS